MPRLSYKAVAAELRLLLESSQAQAKLATEEIARKVKEIEKITAERNEARRRTIPIMWGGMEGDFNFLPMFVETIDQNSDIAEASLWSGLRVAVPVNRRCRITLLASMEPGKEPQVSGFGTKQKAAA
jgi:hypothetical protein